MRFIKLLCSALLIGVVVSAGMVARADDPSTGRAGRAEVRFLQGMIDHHTMALDMAGDCLKKAKTDSVLKLCQGVIDAQSAEIKTMRGWLLSWYDIDYTPMSMLGMADLHGSSSSSGGHGGHNQPATDPAGMMGMMAGLNRLEGREYEVVWLEAMIDHHDDALHMSERVLKLAQHTGLKTMAEAIITAQTAEITLMEQMILDLSK
jgi:uncharacterized protein (DUF305 family)